MKGDISSMTQTIVLAAIMATVILISLALVMFMWLMGGGQIKHGFEVVGIFNKPFALAEALSSFRPNDRSFLENALESSVAGSLQKSGSQNMQAPVKDFLTFFGLKTYDVKIDKGTLTLFRENNFFATCSEGKGLCTSAGGRPANNVCGEGRQQLPDKSPCSSSQVCCSSAVSENVKKCGRGLEGACTSVTGGALAPALSCGEGREVIYDDNKCAATQVCCRYKDIRDPAVSGKAEIPLIYKGEKTGDVKVDTG